MIPQEAEIHMWHIRDNAIRWLLQLSHGKDGSNSYHRQKRYLLFTTSTQWGVYGAVSVPIHPTSNVAMSWFLEANYYNVANASYWHPLFEVDSVSRDREERSTQAKEPMLTRKLLYQFTETMLEKHGFPGRPCLVRAVCENTSTHYIRHNGVVGDLLHLALTPSSSTIEEELEDCFYEAEYMGEVEHDCRIYTETCTTNPIELISVHFDELLEQNIAE